MSTFSYEKILNITNIVAKNNIEEISNITDKTLPNFVDILNKPAKERKGFKYIDDDIQEPYLELENYFFKINYKNNYSKLFIKKLYNLSNVYFYDFQEEPNINLYNGIVLNKDELIECHKNEYYDLTFENFCKGKLSIYNINTR